MDFTSMWARASAAATEVAAAAQEQAKAAAAAAQEQAEALQRTEAFGHLERTLGEIRANTIAAAEQGERNLRVLMENDDEKRTARALADASPEAHGVDDHLREFLAGLTPETFAEYPRDALHAEWEMTPWRETHARLVLDRVPAVGQLRYAIVPRRLDDEQFWRVYFALCAPRLAKHEAANAAAELRRRRFAEAEAAAAAADDAVEIEMTAAGDAHRADTDAGVDAGDLAVPLSVGPAEAAAALAAEYADVRTDEDDDDHEIPSSGAVERAGSGGGGSEKGDDLEAYLRDMLQGGSSDEEGEGEGEEGEEGVEVDLSALLDERTDDDDVGAEAFAAGEDENEDEDVDADATFTTPVKGGDEWETVDVSSAEKKED